MKKLLFVIGLFFCTGLLAQQNNLKNDIIVTTDGQFLQVKVTKVSNDVITFSYPGESLANEIKPDAIDKIVFASGRTQNFNGSPTKASIAGGAAVEGQSAPEEKVDPGYIENTMAVVPLEFEKNGAYEKNLAGMATDYMMSLVSKTSDTRKIEVLPMDKAIEKLLDAGIDYNELREASPEQLRKLFGTEYILYLSINEKQKDSVVNVGKTDYILGGSDSENLSEMERVIKLSVYGAANETKVYGLDFSEQVFMKATGESKKSENANDNAWKSSLEYLVDKLFSSPTFSK